jgi:hypothetical protein
MLSCLAGTTLPAWGQSSLMPKEIVIEGYTSLPPGEEVRLVAFKDLLTYTPFVADKDRIDKNGHFKLTYASPQITVIQLAIRTSKAEMIVAPGWTYFLDVEMDKNAFDLLDPSAVGAFLQVRPRQKDTLDLNYKINRFNYYLENACQYFIPNMLYQNNKDRHDSLMLLLRKHFPVRKEPANFYQSYMYYAAGAIDLPFYHKKADTIYSLYFDNDNILYNNPAYMTLFKEFYGNYFSSTSISKNALNEYINIKPNYRELFNEIGRNPIFVNERVRELAIILNLWQSYGKKEFFIPHIEIILNYIKENTHFEEHKVIVEDVLSLILAKNEQYVMDSILFTSPDEEKKTLQDCRGKWIYVQFYNLNCTDCIREMLIIKELQEKYKDTLLFVSISLDFNFEDFAIFYKTQCHLFPWQFLHFNQQYMWLDILGVNTLPDALLISPSGKLNDRLPPPPSEGLSEYLLHRFFKPEDKKGYKINR